MEFIKKQFIGICIGAIVIIFLLVIVTVLLLCLANGWGYYFFDLFIKSFTGIAAIATAWGFYWKWNDEKRRKIYEERIQKVYAPLIKVLINQESYRMILQGILKMNISRDEYPVFGDSEHTQHYKIGLDGKKVFDHIGKSEEKIYMSQKYFLDVFEASSLGLARPVLLSLIARYTLLLKYKNDCWEDLRNQYPDIDSDTKTPERTEEIKMSDIYIRCMDIDPKIKKVGKSLCEEIVDGYNDSLEKLGLDKQRINLNSPDFIK